MKTRLLLPLLALLPVVACDSSEPASEDGVVEPSIDGKSDEFSGVEDRGTLRFGDTVDGTFDEDFQFFEYTFHARANAELDIEITQAGSSRDLDTTLFLYRNDPDGGAPSRIGFDDDGGYGALSRITDYRLYSEGEYTIVVGTKSARGRGNFRLSLGCTSGECESEVPTPECHPFFEEALAECFEEIGGYDYGFEVPGYELIDECHDWVTDSTESICPTDDEPLCEDSTPFVDACVAKWETEYVRPANGLTGRSNAALDAFATTVADSDVCDGGEDAGCWFSASLFSYEGEAPGAPALLSFAREQSDVGPGTFLDQSFDTNSETLTNLADQFGARAEFDAFVADAGLTLDDASVSVGNAHGEFQWNWGDCEGAVFAAAFPTERRVLVLQDVYCNG